MQKEMMYFLNMVTTNGTAPEPPIEEVLGLTKMTLRKEIRDMAGHNVALGTRFSVGRGC
jgi:hypothetical protein